MDTPFQEAFDAGRTTGRAEAIIAVYRVLTRYKGPEQHEAWMALMDAVQEISKNEES